jgi:rare lipoprotein A (peptidoglycan hydrolase)
VVKKPKPGETSSSNQSVTTNKKVENTPVPTNGLYTVETGETLYSVARKFGLSVNQIKAWNSLQSEELKVGQSIYVSAPVQGRTQTETVTQTKKDVDPVSKPDTRQETKKDVTTQPVVTKNETTEARNETKPQTIKISESMKNSDEVVESGVAELIEGTEGNRKYLALHRTAPVGTILKVRNEMNNREVFVRVMGKLPDTAVNDKLVIKISRSAYDRLGAIDPRFRVELTYYK